MRGKHEYNGRARGGKAAAGARVGEASGSCTGWGIARLRCAVVSNSLGFFGWWVSGMHLSASFESAGTYIGTGAVRARAGCLRDGARDSLCPILHPPRNASRRLHTPFLNPTYEKIKLRLASWRTIHLTNLYGHRRISKFEIAGGGA